MLTVGELRKIFENIENEYGSDSQVVMSTWTPGNLKSAYCYGCYIHAKNGTVYLTSHDTIPIINNTVGYIDCVEREVKDVNN